MTTGAGQSIARAPTAEARPDARAARFAIFLELERAARAAEDPETLGHRIVNDTRRLLAYRTACLLRRQPGGALRVAAISDVASHDPRAPVPALADRIVRTLEAGGRAETSQSVPREGFSASDLADWDRYLPTHLMWTPFKRPDGTVTGGVLYGRDTPFGPADLVLADQIADAYGHADAALARARRRIPWPSGRLRLIAAAGALALLALLAVPVRQTALAPAEVVAADPAIVAAPADGVLTGFAVTPGKASRRDACCSASTTPWHARNAMWRSAIWASPRRSCAAPRKARSPTARRARRSRRSPRRSRCGGPS